MIFKEFNLHQTNGCILPKSITLKKNGKLIKFRKGTTVNTEIIKLLKTNNILKLYCFKIEKDELDENSAAEKISNSLISNHQKNLIIKNFLTGRSNIIANKDGVFYYDENKLFEINNVSNNIAVSALRPYTRVIKGQELVTTKIIPYAIKKNDFQKINIFGKGCFNLAPFKKIKVGLIQTYTKETKSSILDKTKLITENRLKSCGVNSIFETRTPHDEKDLNKELEKCIKKGYKLILIFGVHAISDVRDLIPRVIKKNKGTIIRIGMPVEPGNLILISKLLKKDNNETFIIGMPSCAKSPKENGADWILWRIISGLKINNKIINKMGIGGLLK